MTGSFPTCQDISLTIAPGAEETRAVNGEMLAIISATLPFLIAFDSGSWQVGQAGLSYQGRSDGSGARPRFAALRFRNPTATPITVDVQVSNGDIFDNRAIFGAGSVPVAAAPGAIFDVAQASPWVVQPITFAAPQGVTQSGAWSVGQAGVWAVGLTDTYLPRAAVPSVAEGTAVIACSPGVLTSIYPANANRCRAILHHLGTELMIIKTNSVNNDNGIPFFPGERLEIEVKGEFFVRNPAAFSQSVRKCEVVW